MKKLLHREVYPESEIEHLLGSEMQRKEMQLTFFIFLPCIVHAYMFVLYDISHSYVASALSSCLTHSNYLSHIAVYWHHFSLTVLESFAFPLVVHFERCSASQTCCHFYSQLSRIKRPYSARLPSGLRDCEAAYSSD